MKVLKKGRKPWTWVFECTGCGARLEVNESDDCREDPQGLSYVFKCSECGEENWAAKSMVQRASGRAEAWRQVPKGSR